MRRISSLNRQIELLSTLNQQTYKIIMEYPGLIRDYGHASPDLIKERTEAYQIAYNDLCTLMIKRKDLWKTIQFCALRIPYNNQPEHLQNIDLSCIGLKNYNSFFDFNKNKAKSETEQRMGANGSPFFR